MAIEQPLYAEGVAYQSPGSRGFAVKQTLYAEGVTYQSPGSRGFASAPWDDSWQAIGPVWICRTGPVCELGDLPRERSQSLATPRFGLYPLRRTNRSFALLRASHGLSGT